MEGARCGSTTIRAAHSSDIDDAQDCMYIRTYIQTQYNTGPRKDSIGIGIVSVVSREHVFGGTL
jgi:hypothetical protein